MTLNDLEQQAYRIFELRERMAHMHVDADEALAAMEGYADTLLRYVREQRGEPRPPLSDDERALLMTAHENASRPTPVLTELRSQREFQAAERLRDLDLVAFTCVPFFILITARGARFVEGHETVLSN